MASSWTITGQQPDQIQFIGGQSVTGHLISFRTGEGWVDSVFVPDSHYNPRAIRILIQAKANTVDEVGALSAGSVPAIG